MTQIVFEHLGSWVPTPKQPICALDQFKGDLKTQKYCDWSLDTAPGQGSYVNLYEVRDFDIGLLTADEYIRNFFYCDIIRAHFPLSDFTRTQLFNLLRICEEESKRTHAALKLLSVKKFRSSFRESLKNQLAKWLSEENHAYNSPFSPRQWEILTQYER